MKLAAHSSLLEALGSFVTKRAAKDDETIFELTNFDVQEVSIVDSPANVQEWLAVKGIGNMKTKALQEILGNGVGEFVSKLGEGDNLDGDGNGQAGEGDGDGDGDTPPVLKLSETVKVKSLQSLGVVIKALVEVAKVVDGAEVANEGGEALPNELVETIGNASAVLAELTGERSGGGDNTDKAGDDVNKGKGGDNFSATLEQIQGLLTNVQEALDPKGAAANESGKGDSPDVKKALGQIATLLKNQAEEITDLRETIGLPASGPAGERVSKRREDEDFSWPIDLNRPTDKDSIPSGHYFD